MSLLGIDIGTTGCKLLVLATDGRIVATAAREYDTLRPQPDWAELDSAQTWALIRDAIGEVAAQTAHDPISAVCAASMGEAMTPVSAGREILGNCVLGFDTRGAETLSRLAALDPLAFFARSGNAPAVVYGGPKLIWLRDHRPELFERAYKFLSWADLAAYLLGGEPVTDFGLANRSLFLDIQAEKWSDETLALVGMPADKLPGLARPGTPVGTVSSAVSAELGLPPGATIVVGTHDQPASALGAGVIRPGMAAYGLGTYVCITPVYDAIPPAAPMVAAGLNAEHHAVPGLYVSFYYNLTGGALLKWFRDTFAAQEHAAARRRGEEVYDLLLAEMPAGPTGLLVLPHFAPTGPPAHDPHPYGLIAGLTLATSRGEFIKGLLEGVTYYFREGLDHLAAAGIAIEEYRVTGGGARSDAWLQIKADILGRPLARPHITEASALGAAMLAGLGAGVFSSTEEAVDALVQVERVFTPDAGRHRRYEERFALYGQLYPFSRALRDAAPESRA
jgi:xylulokinase